MGNQLANSQASNELRAETFKQMREAQKLTRATIGMTGISAASLLFQVYFSYSHWNDFSDQMLIGHQLTFCQEYSQVIGEMNIAATDLSIARKNGVSSEISKLQKEVIRTEYDLVQLNIQGRVLFAEPPDFSGVSLEYQNIISGKVDFGAIQKKLDNAFVMQHNAISTCYTKIGIFEKTYTAAIVENAS